MFSAFPVTIAGNSVFEIADSVQQDMIQKFIQQMMTQARANIKDNTAQTNISLTRDVVNEQIRSIALSADSTIANAKSERLLGKLADNFNLISSMQRNIS